MTSASPEVAKLVELTKDIRICMLTTVDTEGEFISRPMAHQQVESDSDLWFFSERDSRKVRQIAANPHVGVALSSNDSWVSINGTAEIVTDNAKAKELWNAAIEAWLPQGPEDPSVVLIKVTGDTAEYWDSPGGRVASVLSFVKAKTTGEPYRGTDTAKVDL